MWMCRICLVLLQLFMWEDADNTCKKTESFGLSYSGHGAEWHSYMHCSGLDPCGAPSMYSHYRTCPGPPPSLTKCSWKVYLHFFFDSKCKKVVSARSARSGKRQGYVLHVLECANSWMGLLRRKKPTVDHVLGVWEGKITIWNTSLYFILRGK